MHIKVLGIDLAKNVFQLCAINQAGKDRVNHPLRHAKLAATLSNLEPTMIRQGRALRLEQGVQRLIGLTSGR